MGAGEVNRAQLTSVITAEAKPLWLLLGGFVFSWICGRGLANYGYSELGAMGFLLQLFGLLVVAVGHSNTRKLFGRPSILTLGKRWLKRLIGSFRQGDVIILGQGGSSETSAGVGSISIESSQPAPTLSIEERVDLLEQNSLILEGNLLSTRSNLGERIKSLKKQFERDHALLRTRLGKDSSLLERLAVSGLTMETVGLIWLAAGLAISFYAT